MHTRKRILAIGEILFDELNSNFTLGGAPLNAAAFIQQVADPKHFLVSIISRIGNDPLGKQALSEIRKFGLNMSGIQRDAKHATGNVTVTRSPNGETYTIHTPRAYDHLVVDANATKLARAADVIIFGSLILRLPQNRKVLNQLLNANKKADAYCDINLRKDCYSKSTIQWCLKRASLLKLNEDEVKVLQSLKVSVSTNIDSFFKDIFKRYKNINECLVTRGSQGLLLATRDYQYSVTAIKLKTSVKDTIGCGDAVTGAYCLARLSGMAASNAAEYANVAGAYAATKNGGIYAVSAKALRAIRNF